MSTAPAGRRPWSSLSGRVALGAVGGLVVAALLFVVVAVSLIRGAEGEQARAELDRQARAISVLVSASVTTALDTGADFRPGPIGNLQTLAGPNTKVYYVGLNLSPGAAEPTGGLPETVAKDLDPAQLMQSGSQAFGFTPTGERTRTFAAAAPVTVGTRYVGAVVVTRPESQVGASLGSVLPQVLVATLVGLVVALVLVLWITRRSMRPLHEMESAAQRVAAGDLTATVATGGADELNAVARAFNEMVRQLERRDRLAREFLMRITHDLRTPLTAIKGHATALSDGVVPDADVPRSLGAIGSESTRLEGLVTDLLDLARMDADQFRVQLVTVPAALPLEQAADALWSTAERKGVSIDADLPDLPEIVTDPDRVQQVVTNLIDNAIRWTPVGGTVHVSARPTPDGGVTADVSDTGPGIAPDIRDVLFDPFRSMETPEGNQGSGLGLAIAHQLARTLGGDLTAGDAPGGGACFTLRLPAAAPTPRNDVGPPSVADEGPTPTAMGGQA